MDLQNLRPINDWKIEGSYLVDIKTGKTFENQKKSSLRGKAVGLSLVTPLAHMALAIANIAYRLLRTVSCYHLWKKQDGPYDFKARSLEMGKDALNLVTQPLALLALEVSAIYMLVSPYNGMKLYDTIEEAQYGRQMLAKLFGIGTVIPSDSSTSTSKTSMTSVSSSDDQESSTSITSDTNPNTTLSPLEQSIIQCIQDRSKKLGLKNELVKLIANTLKENNQDDDLSNIIDSILETVASKLKEYKIAAIVCPTKDQILAKINEQKVDTNADDDLSSSSSSSDDESSSSSESSTSFNAELPSIDDNIDNHLNKFKSLNILKADLIKCAAESIVNHIPGIDIEGALTSYLKTIESKVNEKIKNELLSPNINRRYKIDQNSIASKVFELVMKGETQDDSKLSALEKFDLFKPLFEQHMKEIVYQISTSPKTAAEELKKLKTALPKESITPVYKAIESAYEQHFKGLLAHLEKQILNEEMVKNLQAMNELLSLVDDDEIVDNTKVAIYINPLNDLQIIRLNASKLAAPLYATVSEVGDNLKQFNDGLQTQIKSINNFLQFATTPDAKKVFEKQIIDQIIEPFIKVTKYIQTTLNPHDLDDSKDLFLGYLLRFLKGQIETTALEIKPMLDQINLDLQDQEQSELSNKIKESIQYLQKTLRMDLEFKVEMDTGNDELIVVLMTAIENSDAKNWIAKHPNHDFNGFKEWLQKDDNATNFHLFYENVTTLDGVYAAYLSTIQD